MGIEYKAICVDCRTQITLDAQCNSDAFDEVVEVFDWLLVDGDRWSTCTLKCDACAEKENAMGGNPGDKGDERKFDGGKLRYDLIPPQAIAAIAECLTYGANKYEANSWQKLDNFNPRYTAALMRHFEAWRDGEELDPESGLHHLAHVLCNATFLLCGPDAKEVTE